MLDIVKPRFSAAQSRQRRSAGLIERPKTVNKRSPTRKVKGHMKKMLLLAVAVALIGPLFVGCGSTQISKRRESAPAAGLAGPTQQPSQGQTNPEGVVDVGPKVQPQEVAAKLVKGKTTLDEVMALLGPPQHIAMAGSEGGRTVMYQWMKQLQGGYSLSTGQMLTMSLPGPFQLLSLKHSKEAKAKAEAKMAAVRNSFKSLTLIFERGVLKDFQFSPPIPGFASIEGDSPPLAAVTPPR